MSLDKVLAISGKPGIYELKTQTRAGFLAESLLDGKKISVSIRHNVSILSEIAIYTLSEEVPLRVILQPDYDEDRVYPSDIKKIVQWYNILQKKGMLDFSDPDATDEEE